jgi:hypothetical protein
MPHTGEFMSHCLEAGKSKIKAPTDKALLAPSSHGGRHKGNRRTSSVSSHGRKPEKRADPVLCTIFTLALIHLRGWSHCDLKASH